MQQNKSRHFPGGKLFWALTCLATEAARHGDPSRPLALPASGSNPMHSRRPRPHPVVCTYAVLQLEAVAIRRCQEAHASPREGALRPVRSLPAAGPAAPRHAPWPQLGVCPRPGPLRHAARLTGPASPSRAPSRPLARCATLTAQPRCPSVTTPAGARGRQGRLDRHPSQPGAAARSRPEHFPLLRRRARAAAAAIWLTARQPERGRGRAYAESLRYAGNRNRNLGGGLHLRHGHAAGCALAPCWGEGRARPPSLSFLVVMLRPGGEGEGVGRGSRGASACFLCAPTRFLITGRGGGPGSWEVSVAASQAPQPWKPRPGHGGHHPP